MLVLKDNRGYTMLDIQDERGIDLDIDRWRRCLLKAPYKLSSHHCVMFVQPRFIQRDQRCRFVAERFEQLLPFGETGQHCALLGNASAIRAGEHE